MNERQSKRVHSYYCDFCKQYHIGRTRDGNENLNQPITGAEIYSEITESDVRPFDSLSPEEKLIYNLLAETVEEVLEDKESRRKTAKWQKRINMNEEKKVFQFDDLINDFFADLETGDENKVLENYIKDFPEFEIDLLEAAAYQQTVSAIPEREYSQEEEEKLTLRTNSIVQNILYKHRQSDT